MFRALGSREDRYFDFGKIDFFEEVRVELGFESE